MYNITAYLTIKNKTFYTVLTYYVEGSRKLKWVSTGIKEHESRKKAENSICIFLSSVFVVVIVSNLFINSSLI